METLTLLYILLTVFCNHSTKGQPCQTTCEWMSWYEWSECSVTCGGGGQQNRSRPLCCPGDSDDINDFYSCANYCGKDVNEVAENRSCGDVCLYDGTMKIDGYGCQCKNRSFGHCCEQPLEVARQSERRQGMVTLTYAFVLTDGMSTKRDDTRIAAKALMDANVRVIAIGIGREVSHKELIDIASPGDQYSPSYVFSVGDFNALYALLKQLVDITCDDCTALSHFSDIVFLLDEGNGMTENVFEISVDVMKSIVENTDNIGEYEGATFALLQLRNSLKYVIRQSSGHSKSDIILQLQILSRMRNDVCSKDDQCEEINITTAINETFYNLYNSTGRQGARKFLVVLSNGQYEDPSSIKDEMAKLYDESDVKVFVVGIGPDINMDGLLSLAKEASQVYVTKDGIENSKFTVMQSEFTYNLCK